MVDVLAPDLDIEDAALILVTCSSILERLDEKEIDLKPTYEPLPRGVMTCGQAMTIVPLLMVLITKDYPTLLDQEVFLNVIRDASLKRASGRAN